MDNVTLEKSFIRVMGKRRTARALQALDKIAAHERSLGNTVTCTLDALMDCIIIHVFVNGCVGGLPGDSDVCGYCWRIFTVEWDGKQKAWVKQPVSQKDEMISSLERVAGLVGKVPYKELGGAQGGCNF